MKLGISSYTYTWAFGVGNSIPVNKMTASDLVKLASKKGLHLVQVADNFPIHSLSLKKQLDIKHLADDLGVGIEVGCRGLTEDKINIYLEIADRLASPFLRFVIDENGYEPDLHQIVAIIQSKLESFHAADIDLAIENHDRFTCKELINIIHQTDPARVGICLDTVNSFGAGEGIQEVTTQLLPYAINFHIKDFMISRHPHQMGFEITGAPAGKGLLDLLPIIDQLKNFQRCVSCTLELWTPPEVDLAATLEKESAWADQSLLYLQETGKFLMT
ncbi:MAG: TIM barrel protein [Alphaproteobacteria bacterium]|nr:TIM barrel protein [Alphaproteobacteria bacterium]